MSTLFGKLTEKSKLDEALNPIKFLELVSTGEKFCFKSTDGTTTSFLLVENIAARRSSKSFRDTVEVISSPDFPS